MATSVRLDVGSPQYSKTPFDADVVVTGTPAGATVTVTLKQTNGLKPFWDPKIKSRFVKDAGSILVFTFEGLELLGPTWAVILATAADDKATVYPSDTKTIEVRDHKDILVP